MIFSYGAEDPRLTLHLVAVNAESYAAFCLASFVLQSPLVALHCNLQIHHLHLEFDEVGRVQRTVKELSKLLFQVAASPDALVGFTQYIWNVNASLHTAKLSKAACENVTVLFGGQNVAHVGASYLEEHPFIDILVRGEGEQPLRDILLSRISRQPKLSGISNLVVRENGAVRDTGLDPKRTAPADAPPPISTLMNISGNRYPYSVGHLKTFGGCFHRCAYCAWNATRVHAFSWERTEAELRWFYENRIKKVHVIDAFVNHNPGRLRKFCALMKQYAMPESEYYVEVDIGRLTQDAAAVLRTVPGLRIEGGFESVTPRVLEQANRRLDPERFMQGLRIADAHGLALGVALKAGMPGEDCFGFEQSLDCVARGFLLSHLQVYQLQVLPNSRFGRELPSQGVLINGLPPHQIVATREADLRDIHRMKTLAEVTVKEYNAARKIQTQRP